MNHLLKAETQAITIANTVMRYREAQANDHGVYSTTHCTLMTIVRELESYGIDKERFYRALDRTYGNTANW